MQANGNYWTNLNAFLGENLLPVSVPFIFLHLATCSFILLSLHFSKVISAILPTRIQWSPHFTWLLVFWFSASSVVTINCFSFVCCCTIWPLHKQNIWGLLVYFLSSTSLIWLAGATISALNTGAYKWCFVCYQTVHIFVGSFFKFIAVVFSFRKGYLSQRNETGHLSFSPTAEANQQNDAYFVLIFFLVFLWKIGVLSEAKDA